jgi:hypothetical protein
MKARTYIVQFDTGTTPTQYCEGRWSEVITAHTAPEAGLLACESYGFDPRWIISITLLV